MRRLAYLLTIVALLGAAGLGALQLIGPADSTEEDKGVLASLISKALSRPGMTVSVGAVDGALSSNASIRDIVIADAGGPWLKLDRARIIWTRSALIFRRLSIDSLEIGKLELLRRPIPVESGAASPPTDDTPILPELPVRVEIAKFSLEDLALGADYFGEAAHLSAGGHASLGNPSEGLDLLLSLKRTDKQGQIDAQVSFVPATTALKLTFAAHEAAGGLIARAASLPGLPPVDLDLAGDGRLDAFAANLDFKAGSSIGAQGKALLNRQGVARLLTLDAAAQIAGLLPPAMGPVFAGDTRLNGVVRFGDDGSYRTDGLSVVAAAARLDVSGSVAANNALDARVTMRSLDEAGGVRTGEIEIRKLSLEATAQGTIQTPRIAARFLLDGARLPMGDFGHVEASLNLTPSGAVTDAATQLDLAADARGDNLAVRDAGLAAAVGDRFALTLRGRANLQGETDLSVARLTLSTAEASYAGKAGGANVDGRLTASAPDLARFAALAGLNLRGALKAEADLKGAPARGDIDANVAASIERAALGVAAADALIGGRLDVRGGIALRPGGGFAFSNLAATGVHVTVLVNGAATRQAADVTLTIDAPDLARIDRQIGGRARATARLTGTLDRPDVGAQATLTDASAMGRAIPRLALDMTARDLLGALDARATLNGEIARRPARATVAAQRGGDGGWRIVTNDFAVGASTATIDLTLDAQRRASGRVTVKAPDLDDISPLVLQRLSGNIDADIVLAAPGGRQNAAIKARAQSLRAAGFTLDRFDADLRLADLYGATQIDGIAAIDRAVVGGETLSRLRLNARPAASGAAGSDVTVSTQLRGVALDAQARLLAGDRLRLMLNTLTARKGAQRLLLARPATIEATGGGATIWGFELGAGSGRLSFDGAVGDRLDLVVAAKGMPLAFASLFAPELALDGTLDADGKLSGSANAPSGDWRVRVARLNAAPIRAAGLPPIEINGSGRLQGGRSTVQADVNLGKAGKLTVSGAAPIDGSARLDIGVRGTLDATIANLSMAASGRSVTGRVAVDARAQGALANPRLSGSATLTGGSFRDPLAGVRFDRIEAVVRGEGDQITIQRASAATKNGGTISASGTVRASADAGFPANLHITGHNAELVSNDIVTAVAELALDLSGPLARRPRINGRVTLNSMDVTIPNRLPFASRPLGDVKHVNPPPQVRERLAMEKKQAARAKRAPPFDADLDLTLSAPSRIFVRGRGVDAELGGDLRLTGALSRPVAVGAFSLRRGRVAIASQQLDFSKGAVNFNGDLTPNLDFVASTTAADVTANVEVSGPAGSPTFAFTSTPELPQDEVISRLLFAKAAGGLTAPQALQLAQTVAELTGEGGGGFDRLRKSLGVDTLDVGVGADGSPRVGASRYISKNISVGVKAGAKAEDSGVTVGVDVIPRVRVQGEVDSDGKASLGIGTEWEY